MSELAVAPSKRRRRGVLGFLSEQFRIIGALFLREMATRFGREGIGFVWLIVEPLAFCVGVLIMWSLTKPAYEHGVKLQAFVMTGYISLIILRHMVAFSLGALQANIGLLHHRKVKPLHVFLTRNLLEFGGATCAFIVVYVALVMIGQVDPPHDLLIIYLGWLLLAWIGMGFALILAGLSIRFEMLERVVPLLTYLLIPLSGAFFMVDWLPPRIQETFLLMPFAHPIEMIRAGVFGEFVKTHYNPPYALAVGTGMNIFGMLLIAGSRDRIDVE